MKKMSHGLTLQELEAQTITVLPSRNTMQLIPIGPIAALNEIHVLEKSNLAPLLLVLTDNNSIQIEQVIEGNASTSEIVGGFLES